MKIDLNAFREKDGQTDFGTVERQLAKIDDAAAKIVQKLEMGAVLTGPETAHVTSFILESLQLQNGPRNITNNFPRD